MPTILQDNAFVNASVTNQYNTSDFKVRDYVPDNDDPSAGDISLPDRLDVMIDAGMTVAAKGVSKDKGMFQLTSCEMVSAGAI